MIKYNLFFKNYAVILTICVGLPLLIIAIAVIQPYIDPEQLFRDPLEAAAKENLESCCKPYLGAVSNIGVILWTFAAAIGLFGAWLSQTFKLNSRYSAFLLASGGISFMLMLDDLFLAHEKIYPYLLGIQENTVFLIYVLIILWYLIRFSNIIWELDPWLLKLSLIFFVVGILVDIFYHSGGLIQRIGEDGNKFLGISTWTAFIIRSAWFIVCNKKGNKKEFIKRKPKQL